MTMNLACCVAALATVLTPQGEAASLEIAALRLGAIDVTASVDFYERHLGFVTVARYPNGAIALADARGVYLVITAAERPVQEPRGASHVRFNFAVDDLDAAVTAMEADGVRFVSRGESAVGRYASFVDPSGHVHNLKELFEADDDEQTQGPRVYNAAIAVPDMATARSFYEGVLGFEPLSDAYYPPVVPMKPAGSTMFILSDRQTRRPSAYDYGTGAFAGLSLETSDLVATAQVLREAGVEFIHDAPVAPGASIILMAFRDPFGNVHELIQHTHGEPTVEPTLEDLSFLAGTWRSTLGGTPLEETWSEPEGDHMLGMLRWYDDQGRAKMFEIFTISREDDGLVYRLRHFDGDLQPWASESEGPLVFSVSSVKGRVLRLEPSGGAEGLEWATYDASEPGRLVFRLEFSEETGRSPLVIEFERK